MNDTFLPYSICRIISFGNETMDGMTMLSHLSERLMRLFPGNLEL